MTTSTQKIAQMLGTARPGSPNVADASIVDTQSPDVKKAVKKVAPQPGIEMAEQLANCLNPINQRKSIPS
jgi:hypothetical protein